MNPIWKSMSGLALAVASLALAGSAVAQGQQGGPQGARPQGAPQGGPPPGGQGGPPRGPAPDETPEPPPAGAFVQTVLNGQAVVGGQGDSNAIGSFNARIEAEAGKMCYWLNAHRVAVPTVATINRGAARAAGQPVVTLRPPLGSISQQCVQIPVDLAHQMADNPEQFYVTIGDLERPNGAIRGQLVKANG